MALPPFLDTFTEHYQPARDSALFKAKCMTCHTSKDGGARNAYGKDLDKAIHEAGSHELTVAALALIESKDSDGDGATNIEEIRAGFLPGDRSNRPPAEEGEPAVTSRPPTPPPAELIPKHSFHPLIVHFPIGLFIFGAFLEFFWQVAQKGGRAKARFLEPWLWRASLTHSCAHGHRCVAAHRVHVGRQSADSSDSRGDFHVNDACRRGVETKRRARLARVLDDIGSFDRSGRGSRTFWSAAGLWLARLR